MGVRVVLEDMALVAQLSGLHAIMLIALALRLLRIPQCEAQCAKLEQRARRLRALLQWQAPAGRDVATAMAAEVLLVEADGLVGSYRRSTLWCRVRTGRSMEARLRDARECVDCLCALVLGVHANLLALHPASDTSATNHHMIGDPLQGAEACDDSASDSQRYSNGSVEGGAADHNTEAGEFDSAV